MENLNGEFMSRLLCQYKYPSFLAAIIFAAAVFHNCRACTVFCINKGGMLVTGRSYDWSFGEGIIVVNKRNHFKTALAYWGDDTRNPASWTSKYGSITFVQYGRDIAFDGMNEAGLVVSELWLDESVYPGIDSRTSLSIDQYVQYILDNCGTVDDIIASDALIRQRPTPNNFTKIHFFAADSSGNCVVVEFLNGKAVFHSKDTMPVKAITNDTYENSVNYINRGVPPNPYSSSTLERFYRAANMIADYNPDSSGNIIDYTFGILDAVKQGTWTKFQTVFDIKNRLIYFKSLKNPQLRFLSFGRFDFSCGTHSKILDINSSLSGDVTKNFYDYSTQENENLIRKAWEALGNTNIYQPALEMISRYPDTFECNETSGNNDLENYIPEKIKLLQNYPNPFNPTTIIGYSLSKPLFVNLCIYNILGQNIKILANGYRGSGEYFLSWDGTDVFNNRVSSGVYFYILNAGRLKLQKKMILLR